MLDRFTDISRYLVRRSRDEAKRYNHNYIGSAHLLLSFLRLGKGDIIKIYKDLNLEIKLFEWDIRQHLIPEEETTKKVLWTPTLRNIIKSSVTYADSLESKKIHTTHLFYALVSTEPTEPKYEEKETWKLLRDYNLTGEIIDDIISPQKQS